MRPIMKRIHGTSLELDSLSATLVYNNTTACTSLCCSTHTVVEFDKIAEFAFDLQCERMISTHFLLRPFMCIMNMCSLNTIMAHARKSIGEVQGTSPTNLHRYVEVNQNAVMLDDIDYHWYALEDDCIIFQSKNTNNHIIPKRLNYDDIDLDLYAIHKEAQKYNEFNDLQVRLDIYFLQCLLQHIISHLKDTWSDLSLFQRYTLCHIIRPHINVFDQLIWFGYDCLIRSNDEDLIKILEYNRILNGLPEVTFNNFVFENLAVDFGVNFSFIRDVIFSCDIHFEGSLRTRMSYTKVFCK